MNAACRITNVLTNVVTTYSAIRFTGVYGDRVAPNISRRFTIVVFGAVRHPAIFLLFLSLKQLLNRASVVYSGNFDRRGNPAYPAPSQAILPGTTILSCRFVPGPPAGRRAAQRAPARSVTNSAICGTRRSMPFSRTSPERHRFVGVLLGTFHRLSVDRPYSPITHHEILLICRQS